MDADIKYIIDEEKRLVGMLEDSRRAARERVEEHRRVLAEQKDTEFGRIASEYKSMTDEKLREINITIAGELEVVRREQERFLDNVELRDKITGRIVSVILENRE